MLAATEHATQALYPSLVCNVLLNNNGLSVGGYYGSLDANGYFNGTVVTISMCCVRLEQYNHGFARYDLPAYLNHSGRTTLILNRTAKC